MVNFILTLCAVFATIALIAIAVELSNTRTAVEDLASGLDELNSGLDELNSNIRESSMTKGRN